MNELRVHHQRAVALGAGRALSCDEERLSSPLELIAAAVPWLAQLRAICGLADVGLFKHNHRPACLEHHAGAVVRLVDRAMRAHARDHRYAPDAWGDRALEHAQLLLIPIARDNLDDRELGALVDHATVALADALRALPNDRLGVPEPLADALGTLLAVFVLAGAPSHAN